jgi:phytoene synthase
MMALIMGTRSPAAVARACELGVAMQLTNIARDVGEDAANGRLYLPRAWMREEGLDPDRWLAAPSFSPALAAVVARLLDEADRLYVRAERGIAQLPRDCRAAIAAARWVYAEIGREVARAGHDSVSRRAVVSRRRKVALMLRSTLAVARRPDDIAVPPLAAIQFLVDSALVPVPGGPAPAPSAEALDARGFYARTVWVIELLERLEARNRWGAAGGMHPLPADASGDGRSS